LSRIESLFLWRRKFSGDYQDRRATALTRLTANGRRSTRLEKL
jgi:hypothetical protein